MSERLDDTALMLRYRDGDIAAFDILYARHRGPLFRYLVRHCQDQEQAADLFQEIWAKITTRRAQYRPAAKFTTYLYRVAHNCLVDHYRRHTRRPLSTEVAIEDQFAADDFRSPAQPERLTASRQLADLFKDALGRLPDVQREAFLLREETGLSLDEIARVTGVGPETVKSRLRYAVAKLRAALPDADLAMTGTEP